MHGFVFSIFLVGCSGLEFRFPNDGDGNFTVLENVQPGTLLTTVEGSGGDFTFEMTSNYLVIEPTSGNITVKEGAVIDYEALLPDGFFTAEFFMVEVITGSGGKKNRDPEVVAGNVTVRVTDVNEPPSFDGDAGVVAGFTVLNNSAPRTYIGKVEAIDPDTTDPFNIVRSYQLQTSGTPFVISNAGTIRLQYGMTVDANVTRVWTVVIAAIDDGIPNLTGSATIYICVCGRNSQSNVTGNLVAIVMGTFIYLSFYI